jgi:hypothetical protein
MKPLFCWAIRATVMAALALPVCAAAQAGPAGAGRAAGPRVPVTVAIAEALPDTSVHYVILRKPGRSHSDVILLRSDADETILSDAVRTLLVTRRHQGDIPINPAMLRAVPASDARGAVLPWATRVLNDVRAATARHVEGVGSARAVEIWLPRQTATGPPGR